MKTKKCIICSEVFVAKTCGIVCSQLCKRRHEKNKRAARHLASVADIERKCCRCNTYSIISMPSAKICDSCADRSINEHPHGINPKWLQKQGSKNKKDNK